MSETSMRAIRRHHYERLKRKRIRDNYWYHGTLSERWLGIAINTPTPCSCWMCGNPRKYFKQKTRQEIKHELSQL